MKKPLLFSSLRSLLSCLGLALFLLNLSGGSCLAIPALSPRVESGAERSLLRPVPGYPAGGRALLPMAPAVTTLTQTSCGQSFNVLSSFTAPDATARAVNAGSVSVRNQPANGRVRVNADGTFNFTPTVTTAGASTFTLTALPTSASYVTTSGLTVSQNITCDPPFPLPNLCSIANQTNITSPSLTDFATVSQTTLLGKTTIKATLNGTATAGDRAGFLISSDAFLSASLLQSYTINTYLGASNTVRNTRTFSSLAGINVLSGNLAEISLPTTQSFDRVELIVSSLVGVLATTNVYYGFSRPAPVDQVITLNFPATVCTDVLTQTSCGQALDILSNDIPTGSGILNPVSVTIPTQPANGTVFVNADGTIRFTPNVQTAGTANFSYSVCTTSGPSPTTLVTTGGTSASGITGVCVLCSISNSENVGDANLTNAATISIPVSVTGSGYIRAKLNGVSRAGDLAGFVVGNNNVLTVSLLNAFTIATYRNGELVEQGNGGSLLNLQLLSGGQYEISFQTTRDFDEIEFRTGAFATVLNTTQVYYGFSRFAQTCNSYNAQINFPANVCPPFTFDCANASVSGTFIANNTGGQSGTVVIPFSTPITVAQTGGVTFNASGSGFSASGNPFTTTLTTGQTSVSIPITYNGTGSTGVRTLSVSSALAASPCSVTALVNAIPSTPFLTVLTPVNNTTVTATPTFSGTATPGSLITVLGINGLLTPGVGVTADLLSGTFATGLLLPLSNGPQTLTVVAVNPFNPGLIATQPVTVTVVSQPTLLVVTPVNNTTVTATPTFSGTATPGSLITVLGINGLLTPGVGVTADLLSGTFATGLLLPLSVGGPQTFTVVAVNPLNPGLIATQAVTVTVVSGQPSSLFTLNCSNATVTGVFTANGVAGQTGTLNLPILNALAGPVSLTISGANFSTPMVPFATTLTAGQTAISVPIIFNGNGLAGFQTISTMSNQAAGSCSITVPVLGPVGSLTFTQTSCGQSFSVLSSFSAVGSGAIDPSTVQVVNQPATGTVRVNADGTIRFQPATSSAGTATFTIAAASTLTNVATQQFVTTSDLTVSNNLLCQPIINLCPILNQNNIISASLTDFAHLEQTALLGTTTIKARLNGTGQAGDLAGFIIANPTLLSAAVLPAYTINTYLGNSLTVRDSKTFSSLLDIQLLSGGRQELSFQTTQSFDRVELVVATAAAVLLSTDIYYGFSKPATVYMQKVVTINYGADICTDIFSQTACAQSFTILANDIAGGSGILDPTTVSIPTQPANGTVTVGADGTLMFTPATPTSGTAVFSYSVCTKANPAAPANNTTNGVTSSGLNGICVLCSVTSETAVGDADLTNFATISIPVGVAGSGFVQAKLNQMAPAGDFAGFVIGNTNILSVGLLNSITLSTYKGGMLQEQKTGSSLLTLQLLSGSKYEVKFQTTKQFDEVRFTAGALADVLSNTQVYYGFASFGQVCQSQNVRIEFPANVCAGPPTIVILSPVNNSTVTTTPTISGTATPGSTVVISTVGNATACQTIASASGTYACGITLPVGVQSVTAVATNQNGTSAPATVTVIVVAPANTGYALKVKVLLQGPLLSVPASTTLMNDNIRAGGYLPTTTPYSATLSSRFAQTGGGGGETTTPAVFSANAGTPDAIVDWVLIELRDAANPATIVATRSGLVQRDGDVVLPADGTSPLSFTGLSGSGYYVSVKHRNHLGVMTATSVPLSATVTTVDFTTLTDAQVYDKPGALSYNGLEMAIVNGKRALWAGDANADGKLKYIGLATDNTRILNDVIDFQGNVPNPTYNYDFAFGYFAGDLDMNAKVKYQGTVNDPSVLFNNVVANYPLNTQNLYNYDFFVEQLP